MVFLKRLGLQEESFFSALAAMADHVAETAVALRDYLEDPRQPPAPTHERRLQLDALSSDVDRLIIEAFVTPIDPDDLSELNAGLHTLGDAIDDAARLFVVLRLSERRQEAVMLATLLTATTSQVRAAVAGLDHARVMAGANERVHDLAAEADAAYHAAVATLLTEDVDTLTVLKWKDVYDRLDQLIHMVRRTAKLLQRIAVRSET